MPEVATVPVRGEPRAAMLALALVFYIAVTLVHTWPLALHLSDRLAGDAGDPALNTWILWWNATARPLTGVVERPGLLPDGPDLRVLGAPARVRLDHVADHLAGRIAGACLQRRLSDLVRPLSAWADALLVQAYSPVVTTPGDCRARLWLRADSRRPPLASSGAHLPGGCRLRCGAARVLADAAPRWLAFFASAWLLQSLSNNYYALFVSVLVGLWLACSV